jgi:hypothetical protein
LSNELIETFGTDNYAELAAATGAFTGGSTLLPQLRINREAETDEGKRVPTGTYMVTQNDVTVYGKVPVLFRVFLNTFQYKQYDDDAKRYPNKTIIVKSFQEEMQDELGGIKCGRIHPKELEVLKAKNLISPAEIKKQEQIKCYRRVYGLVTMQDAVTEDGVATTIENLPCVWEVSGVNAPKDALDSITKLRHIFFQHWLVLDKLDRKKTGSNVYYEAHTTAILDKEVEFTKEDMAVFQSFRETIDRENRAISAKWRESKRSTEPYDLEALKELDLNDDVSDIGV